MLMHAMKISLLLLCAVAISANDRQAIKFDFGWRFELGDGSGISAKCPADVAKQFNKTKGRCSGLKQAPNYAASSPDACLAACCADSDCQMWQYTTNTTATKFPCWIGSCAGHLPHDRHEGWIGGMRKVGPTPPPAPPFVPAEANVSFDDSAWEIVDCPHDYIITIPYSPKANVKDGFFPRNNSWYRKHWSLPSDWYDDAVSHARTQKGEAPFALSIRFEGIYKVAMVYLNGKLVANYGDSSAGYTGFNVPIPLTSEYLNGLDGNKGENKNVIAIHVDGSYGTEHWYAGAGIYRHVWLEKTPLVNIAPNGVYAGYSISDSADIGPTVEVQNNGTAVASGCKVVCTLIAPEPTQHDYDHDYDHKHEQSSALTTLLMYQPQAQPITVTVAVPSLQPGSSTTVALPKVTVPQKELKLWSVKDPNLYTLTTTLTCDATTATTTTTTTTTTSSSSTITTVSNDGLNSSLGLRTFAWSHEDGLALNGERVKVRGFCHHDDFTAVGMAVPERVNLFRAQSLRGVGGNGWRMSHNSYRDTLYSTLDRLGVLVWDETRDLRQPQLPAFGQMVKEHRNHPSIMLWSFCNEGGLCICLYGCNCPIVQSFMYRWVWKRCKPYTGARVQDDGPHARSIPPCERQHAGCMGCAWRIAV
jgi:beta-galactosidase/beta-glucuronidase